MAAYPFADFPIERNLIHPPTFLFEKVLTANDANILQLPKEAVGFFRTASAEGAPKIFRSYDAEGMIIDVRTPKIEFAARVYTTGGYVNRVKVQGWDEAMEENNWRRGTTVRAFGYKWGIDDFVLVFQEVPNVGAAAAAGGDGGGN